MPFSELIAQDRALGSLRSALRRGALHHAYLFGGPDGVGKGTAARLLAQAANCEGGAAGAAGHRDDACGACLPCRKIAKGIHPDVLLLADEKAMVKAGRWEARSGKAPSKDVVVDQVRDLVDHKLALRRFEGRRRFVVIDPADAMNPQAQNALLKTLEEPPEDTTLVLVASSPDALLPTIRSRCLRVPFAPIPAERIAARLEEGGVPAAAARLAAELSGGSFSRALAHGAEDGARLLRAVAALAALDPQGGEGPRRPGGGPTGRGRPEPPEASDAGAWLAWAAAPGRGEGEEAEGREAVKAIAPDLLELLDLWLRDVLVAQAGGDDRAVAELAATTARAAAALPPAEVLRRRDEVLFTRQALRQNASPQLALERLAIAWYRHGRAV